MKITRMAAIVLATVAWFSLPTASAQMPAPQNVLQLNATGTVEVPQDMITIVLTTSKDGREAAAVQSQLKAALDAALVEAKRSAEPGQMDVRTGNFSVGPRYAQGGRIDGWHGTAELVLEGRDFARIAQVAGRIPGMTVGNVGFGLSREQRAKVETDAQQIAIDRFKSKAGELARGFGFSGFTLREVSVMANDFSPGPRPRMMAQAMAGAEKADVPIEAGKAAVTVTVSGSVQLR
jgi:predicted secreted protein